MIVLLTEMFPQSGKLPYTWMILPFHYVHNAHLEFWQIVGNTSSLNISTIKENRTWCTSTIERWQIAGTILSPRWFSSFVRSTEWGVAITCLVQIIIFIIIKVMMESHHLYHHKSEDGISFNIIKVMDYHPTDHLRSNKSHHIIPTSYFHGLMLMDGNIHRNLTAFQKYNLDEWTFIWIK